MPYVSVLPEIIDTFKRSQLSQGADPLQYGFTVGTQQQRHSSKMAIRMGPVLKKFARESKQDYPTRSDDWHKYKSELRVWNELLPHMAYKFPGVEPAHHESRKKSTAEGNATTAVSWKDGRKLKIHRKKGKDTQETRWTIRWGWILAVVGVVTLLYLFRSGPAR